MAPLPQLLVATGNAHKVGEIGQLLAALLPGVALELRSAADFPALEAPEENGASFAANALIKARAYARATGLLTLADDSGLVVDALGGRPGIHSARYAATSAACIARLLDELQGVPPERRTARFECVMALADAQGGEATRRGTLEGRIALDIRGAQGFGYDPVFELTAGPLAGLTTAQISAAEKNALSHRGRALAAIAPLLAASLATGRLAQI